MSKTNLGGDLCVEDVSEEFFITVDGEVYGKIIGKENAEKAVLVFVEKREDELKNAYTRVSREKVEGGFAILTQSLGYIMNGSPVQKHVIKCTQLPHLFFEKEKQEEVPEEIQTPVEENSRLIPYNSVSAYELYTTSE